MNENKMPRGGSTVDDQEIVDWIADHEDPFVGAKELAEAFGYTRQWAHDNLQQLYNEGRISKKKQGPRSAIWFTK